MKSLWELKKRASPRPNLRIIAKGWCCCCWKFASRLAAGNFKSTQQLNFPGTSSIKHSTAALAFSLMFGINQLHCVTVFLLELQK